MFFTRKKKPKKGREPYVKREFIVCPFCMEKVKPHEILFMTDSGEHMDETFFTFANSFQSVESTANVIKTAHNHTGQIIEQTDAEFKVRYSETTGFPVEVARELNGSKPRMYTDRICPHCHSYLPNDIEAMELKNIVVLGNTSCGKTSLLAAMMHDLGIEGSRLSPQLGQIQIERDSVPFLNYIIRNWQSASRMVTPMVHVFPIVFRATNVSGSKRILVALHDFAGEGMNDLSYFRSHAISQCDIDAIMLVLDVCQLQAYQQRNVENACEVPITQIFSNLNDEAKNPLRRAHSVAVVLNKFDLLSLNQTPNGFATTKAYLPELTDHRTAVGIATIKDVSATVKKILSKDNPANITNLESSFGRRNTAAETLDSLEYFAASSMQYEHVDGDNAGYTNRYNAGRPLHRVQEPLLYFMARWGIFAAK